jgi:hypothetical protein
MSSSLQAAEASSSGKIRPGKSVKGVTEIVRALPAIAVSALIPD